MSNETRPTWDQVFMAIAEIWMKRSVCLSRKVGCALVYDKRIIGTGYNGPPSGHSHCTKCQRPKRSGVALDLCPAVHAEVNAIAYAARHGIRVGGASIYITCLPCAACAKVILTAGVQEVVYGDDYPSPVAMELFASAGIKVRRVERGT